jgi:hypothetical protein
MPIARRPRLSGTMLALGLVWGGWAGGFSLAQEAEPPAPQGEPQVPKDIDITFDNLRMTEDGDYAFTGSVTIVWRESRIQADQLSFSQQRYIVAEGNVLIEWAGNYIFGSRMEYDLESERGVIEDAFGQVQADYVFWAERAEKIGDDQIHLQSATVTTCTQPSPYWSFAVSSATIRVEGYARMWNVRLRAKKMPFFYLPYLIWPVKEDRAIGLLMPEFHTTETRGRAISQELFIPIGRSADMTLLGRYYTEAGFGGGGEVRFVPNSTGAGSFSGFYIDDKVAGAGRYRAAYDQTQQFRNGFRMVADISLVSDFDYFTDFERELNLITSPQILARLEFSRNGPWTSLNVRELRREQLFLDQSSLVQQTLPEIEWRGRSRRLGRSPFYLSYESSLASIQQREKNLPPEATRAPIDADYLRGDVAPTLSAPLSPVPWLEVTPAVSYRYTYYTQHQQTNEESEREIVDEPLSRQLWGAGLEIVGPKLFRVYGQIDDPTAKAWKHSVETRIAYGYAEFFDRRDDIIPFDEVDRVSGSGNQINYALVQRLFARRPRVELTSAPTSNETIVLPDGTTSPAGLPAPVGEAEDGSGAAKAAPPREAVEIATLELRQIRSFDRDLSTADLDRDGVSDAASPYSDLQLIGRYNPNPNTSLDLRSSFHPLYHSFSGATLSGGIRRQLARVRFSVVHRNGLEVGQADDTQLRLTTGFSLFRDKLRIDLDGSYDYDPPEGQTHVPDKRWRVQYSTQCCTFLFERLTRDYASSADRRDFYFRVDLKGVGKILDINY